MESPTAPLFQLEDGGSLVIAVHSDIPHYDRLCDLIRTNHGILVEDAASADFCIISSITPSSDAIAEELHSEGKLAIQDYWVRDSVDAGYLLPWYPYKIGPYSVTPTDSRMSVCSMSTAEAEERDLHELVVTSARYWPLLSLEELHRYVSRKCPHRSATSFRHLYEAHQADIDSRVSYLRGKLEKVFEFNNDFSRRPRMSFGSPNKLIPLRIQAPPTPSELDTVTVRALMPTPTTTTNGSRGEPSGSRDSKVVRVRVNTDPEAPYEPPNIEMSATASPLPTGTTASAQEVGKSVASSHTARGVGAPSGYVTDDVPRTAPTPIVTPVVRPSSEKEEPVAGGQLVTQQDKYELAKFLVEHPKGRVGFETHVELFRKTNPRGRLRSASSWKYVQRTYGKDIRAMMSKIEKAQKMKESKRVVTTSKSGTAQGTKKLSSTATPRRDKQIIDNSKSYLIGEVMAVKTTEDDKQALAEWLLDNPKDPEITLNSYFELFARQYKVGPPRSAAAWHARWARHKDDITRRQRMTRKARKAKAAAARKHPKSTSGGNVKASNRKESEANIEDVDSDLSSVA